MAERNISAARVEEVLELGFRPADIKNGQRAVAVIEGLDTTVEFVLTPSPVHRSLVPDALTAVSMGYIIGAPLRMVGGIPAFLSGRTKRAY